MRAVWWIAVACAAFMTVYATLVWIAGLPVPHFPFFAASFSWMLALLTADRD